MRQIDTYRVKAGSLTRYYATAYHAEQMARALRGHGMVATVDTVRLPNDPLTRSVVYGMTPHATATFAAGAL